MSTATETQPSAPECAGCGTTGGHVMGNRRRPVRVSVRRLGVDSDGVVCQSCYVSARYRIKVGRDPITGEKIKKN